jgi:hypothetical protein
MPIRRDTFAHRPIAAAMPAIGDYERTLPNIAMC